MIRSFSCIAKVVDTNDTAAVCSVVVVPVVATALCCKTFILFHGKLHR